MHIFAPVQRMSDSGFPGTTSAWYLFFFSLVPVLPITLCKTGNKKASQIRRCTCNGKLIIKADKNLTVGIRFLYFFHFAFLLCIISHDCFCCLKKLSKKPPPGRVYSYSIGRHPSSASAFSNNIFSEADSCHISHITFTGSGSE